MASTRAVGSGVGRKVFVGSYSTTVGAFAKTIGFSVATITYSVGNVLGIKTGGLIVTIRKGVIIGIAVAESAPGSLIGEPDPPELEPLVGSDEYVVPLMPSCNCCIRNAPEPSNMDAITPPAGDSAATKAGLSKTTRSGSPATPPVRSPALPGSPSPTPPLPLLLLSLGALPDTPSVSPLSTMLPGSLGVALLRCTATNGVLMPNRCATCALPPLMAGPTTSAAMMTRIKAPANLALLLRTG